MGKDYFPGKVERPAKRVVAPIEILVAILIAVLLAVGAGYAYGAPRVSNPQECALLADMVLVAASLAKNDVTPEKRLAVMQDTYSPALTGQQGKKWQELMGLAMRFAARKRAQQIAPFDLAQAVGEECHKSRGNLEPIFGPGTES